MKKAQRFYGAALTLSTIASVVAPVAVSAATVTVEDAKAKVEVAKKTPTFKTFNEAYGAVMALTNKDQQAVLLNELAPLVDKVSTKYVKDVLAKMDSLAKDKNLKTYHELMAMIDAETSEAEKVNKEYLMGELYAWGTSGTLYTATEKAAIDAINAAWTDTTKIAAAKEAAAKVTNAGSLEWLNGQIAEISAKVSNGVASVKAVGAKQLEVKFNKAVDASVAKFEVKKGSVTVSQTGTPTFSTDKTTVIIELAGKLTEGEYTVNVTGVETAAISGKVTVTDEKVANVTILSDVATQVTDASYNVVGLKAAYKVVNQYGEDVTKTTSLTAYSSVGAATAQDGKIDITVQNAVAARLGEKVSISLVNTDAQISVSANLTVSNEAKVNTVAVTELYNADKKVLSEDLVDEAGNFMLVIEAKDQYGNKVTDLDALKKQISAYVANQSIVKIQTTTMTIGSQANVVVPNFQTVKINGEDRTVLKLAASSETINGNTTPVLKSGKTAVTFMPTAGGTSTSFDVEVKDGVKVNEIKFSQPDSVVSANKAIKIPFEAFDTYGNAVTKKEKLDKVTLSVTVNGTPITAAFATDYTTGKAYLELTPTDKGVMTINATTPTYKYNYISVNVKEQAIPYSIVGIDSDAPTSALLGETFTLKPANLIVQDQYGRVMGDTDFPNAIDGRSIKDTKAQGVQYRVVARDSAANDSTFTISKVTKDDQEITTDYSAARITTASNVTNAVMVKGDKVFFNAGNTSGSKTIKLVVQKSENGGTWTDMTSSSFDVSARAVKLTDLKTYEIGDIATMFDEVGYYDSYTNGTVDLSKNVGKYESTFTVYGKTADGTKVTVPSAVLGNAANNYYTVTTGTSVLATRDEAATSQYINLVKTVVDVNNTTGASVYAKDTNTLTAQINVVINHDGAKIAKDIVVSKVKPAVASLEFENDNGDITKTDATYNRVGVPAGTTISRSTNGTVANGVETGSVYKITLGDGILDAKDVLPIVMLKDQYGKETFLSDYNTGRFDFVPGISTYITSVTFAVENEIDDADEIAFVNNGSVSAAQATGIEAGDVITVTFTTENGLTASTKVVIQ